MTPWTDQEEQIVLDAVRKGKTVYQTMRLVPDRSEGAVAGKHQQARRRLVNWGRR